MAISMSKESEDTAKAVLSIITYAPKPLRSFDISKELGLGHGRHQEISNALKYLIRKGLLTQIGTGRGSQYLAHNTRPNGNAVNGEAAPVATPLTPMSAESFVEAARPVPEKPHPVVMVEVPRASLKVVMKAVMACCSPMDNVLQRAVLHCMEKLI